MPENGESSYSLCHVLEQEFVALDGELPMDCGKGDPGPGRLKALFRAIHGLTPGRRALCLSGGGIRSATFSLGVLQAFAHHKLLESFDYLSTVSGGGYIGGWLSAWMTRAAASANAPAAPSIAAPAESQAGAKAVIQQLADMAECRPAAEPEPVRNLRRYSNYLSPRLGVLSSETWALGLTFVRNLLLTWLVLVPALAAAVLLPQVYRWLTELPSPPSSIVLGAGIVLGLVGVGYAVQDLPSSVGRRWSVRWFKLGCLLPFTLAALLFSLVWAWRGGIAGDGLSAWHFVLGGAVLHGISALAGDMKGGRPVGTRLRLLGERLLDATAVLVSGGVAGGMIWVGADRVFPHPETALDSYVVFAPAWLVLSLLLGTTAYIGLASTVTGEDDREWWARAGAWLGIASVVWMAAAAVAVFSPQAVAPARHWVAGAWLAAGGASGVVTAIIGYRSSTALGSLARVRGILERYGLNLGAGLFILALLMALAAATAALVPTLQVMLLPTGPTAGVGALFFGALVAAAFLFSWLIGVNRFSLHSMYGNRLVRAYLGASRQDRNPYPLTGFDPKDNLPMHELHDGRPLHVVNLTLNLVGGDELAWQQRRAKSFTVTRLHCGTWYGTEPEALSYRPAARYAGGRGISLGKAVAISGAAASPNMGYHSSPLVGLVMTFFNVRLGWWLGNPNARLKRCVGDPGKNTWERDEPRLGLRPLIEEALGLTTDGNPYVYLSDGGHFENLGLYEMVLRRCRTIVVVDAGCDPKHEYEDLSAAIRKIRSDFGIPVTMTRMPSDTRPWGEGTIHYDAVDAGAPDGLLVCLKPIVTKDAPLDVQRYAATHADPKNPFPQQTTADQFFDESQFESYHALGWHIGDLVGGWLAKAGGPKPVSSERPAA